MNDIFAKHNKKKALKDKLYFYAFYTVLLYLFALMIVLISKDNRICLLNWYCVSSQKHYLQAAFILYLYLLFLVVLLIQTYKLLEKLVAQKNHIRYFKYIFYSIPFLIALIVWIAGTNKNDAWLLIIFSTILSVGGLLMIELRKK
jgi:hypothetical protein